SMTLRLFLARPATGPFAAHPVERHLPDRHLRPAPDRQCRDVREHRPRRPDGTLILPRPRDRGRPLALWTGQRTTTGRRLLHQLERDLRARGEQSARRRVLVDDLAPLALRAL